MGGSESVVYTPAQPAQRPTLQPQAPQQPLLVESRVPLGATPMNESSGEVIVRLRNPEEIYKVCAKLHKSGVPLTGVQYGDPAINTPCYIWMKQSPATNQALTSDNYCSGYPTLPCDHQKSKGTHQLEVPSKTQLQMNALRKQYESQGFRVTAQSPPTEFGNKTLYFTA